MARDASVPAATARAAGDASLLPGGLLGCLKPALVLVDGRGKTTWTTEARQMLGLNGAASDRDSLPAPLLALAREAIQSPNGVPSRRLEYSAEGAALDLNVSALTVRGPDGKSAILVLNDLTPLHGIEHLLLQADRLANIGTLSASMAHEVRNALVACRTFVDLLLEKHQDAELADLVRREMLRIDDMVTRMLRHAATAPANVGPLHVHAVLENALRLLEPQFAEKGLAVERLLEATTDSLDGDENQLQQAFMNLLLNACEASPNSGKLTIQTSAMTGPGTMTSGICVTIADNGEGITKENLSHLFQPFFTTKPDGTGLGLAVTQRIVKEHGGTITVDSRVGEGTSFRLCLPI